MIDTKIIRDYLNKKFNNETFIMSPILGLGEVNQVFKIETRGNTYILRVNEESEYESFVKEQWCCKQAHIIGIPVPQITEASTCRGASFCMSEFIDGKNSFNIKDPKFQTRVFKQLGGYVKKLSQIKPTGIVGNLKSTDEAKKWFYEDYLSYEIGQTSKKDDYLTLRSIQRDFVLTALNLLNTSEFEFVLCHGDISLKNSMYVNQTKTLYLIDFGSAEVHIKDYFEVALKWLEVNYDKTLSESDYQVFVKSVLENSQHWLKDNESIVESLALVYTLDKYRWAHDRSPDLEATYKERFDKVLKLLLPQ